MLTDLHNAELAEHLAITLSDIEFELLVRARIRRHFITLEQEHPNLSDSYHACTYTHSWNDESRWSLSMGGNYNTSVNTVGQVLSRTAEDISTMYRLKNVNKLSLLLPAPSNVDNDTKW